MKKDTSTSTLLVISMGFLGLYLLTSVKWALYVSLIVGVIGIVSPWLSQKIEWIWMKLAEVLSYIVPNIILSIFFFLILFPLALLSKLSRKDPLMLSSKRDSFFITVNRKPDKSYFEKIW